MASPSELSSFHLIGQFVMAGFKVNAKTFIDVLDVNDKPIASVFVDDKYIQFHDEFTQIGVDIPVLKKLMDAGYNHNHT